MAAEPLLPEDPGAVGPYRLVGRLGEGGQGVVYLAQAPNGGPVAVKVLLDGLVGDDRFAKEVAAARRVEPFCIAQVLDASLGARPYVVTEYVEGPSLQQAGRHTGAGLQRLAVATATALAAIHRAGVVHRDFKPANVLLGPGGPRVIDFGIARAAGSALTVTSGIVGTPVYMAPEQLSGTAVGAAADVFAWASVIVYAASGVPPFGNDALPAVINRILNNEPQLGDLPDGLRPIVYACLSKGPSRRPTMQDVLLRLLGGTANPLAAAHATAPGQSGGGHAGHGPAGNAP
ncbi:serine/threonine-protein kinase [Nonomuraea sp. NPDC050022]|uniref:serine/threonine-protein kinase n=1 Tax=Nonomuraea sp. NPDC050022 TaxID=3364358 RepID=UPI00379094EB